MSLTSSPPSTASVWENTNRAFRFGCAPASSLVTVAVAEVTVTAAAAPPGASSATRTAASTATASATARLTGPTVMNNENTDTPPLRSTA